VIPAQVQARARPELEEAERAPCLAGEDEKATEQCRRAADLVGLDGMSCEGSELVMVLDENAAKGFPQPR
jgi:hypothetical protein